MIWVLATLANGETFEYGFPIDEPFFALRRDALRFVSLEILSVEY